jgi:RsmE family RNA methyltransferase
LKHIQEVLGATQGQSLHVGQVNGKVGSGIIQHISPDKVELEVLLNHNPPKALPLTLILAMPRPKVFKRILQGITACGIKKIILINTWRVDKSYWQSPALVPETLQEQCFLGLEQSRDTMLPKIVIKKRFKPFVEDSLPAIAENTCALIAHPGTSRACPSNVQQQTTLAIGPEGGFTRYEVSKLKDAGLTQVCLGERPLRVETAIPALIGRLMPLLGETG